MALPRPDYEAAADTSKFVAPCHGTEIAVAGICCEVLGAETRSVQDNFFGHGWALDAGGAVYQQSKQALVRLSSGSRCYSRIMIAGLAGVIDQMQPEQRDFTGGQE